ncbi:ATP-binding protein [Cryptobacterium curtum]
MSESDLSDFIEAVTGDTHLRVEDDLGCGFVRLRSAEAERRQAKHDIRGTEDIVIEMLRNARDAHAKLIFVAISRTESTRRITMIDDGDGVPDELQETIFEARVTSKLDSVHMDTWGIHGRGMALYAIKMNAAQAFVATSTVAGGSSFVVETDLGNLPEKRDQSAHPQFSFTESGTLTVRGPKNINRVIAEFAYLDRAACSVYAGSPIEIAATLWQYGRAVLSQNTIAFCSDAQTIAPAQRLACAAEPEEFAEIARTIGLELSSRSARRIMDGEVQPLLPVLDTISIERSDGVVPQKKTGSSHQRKPKITPATVLAAGDERHLRLSADDKSRFKEALLRAWAPLARAYYLDPSIGIDIKVKGDRIEASFPVILQ